MGTRAILPLRTAASVPLTCLLALVTGCSPDAPAAGPTSGASKPASCTGGQRYLVAAGADENNASLYDVNGCNGAARKLAGITRVSALATGARTYAVSAAPVDVDQVFRLTSDEHLVPVSGPRAPSGSAPAVSADGTRVAYIALGPPGPTPFTVVEVGASGRSTVLYRTSRPIGAIAYSPAGVLHVATNAPDPMPGRPAVGGTSELFRVQHGVTRVATLPFSYVTGLAVSRDAIAVSGPEAAPGVILSTDGRLSGSFAPRLRVQALTGTGSCLLVTSGRRFGCLDMPVTPTGQPSWVPLNLVLTLVAARPR